MTVRVRFAPSPTGFLHIGGARTALYNYLFAKHTNGKFILRIEDTDELRSTDESVLAILYGIQWLGLGWDEGPTIDANGSIGTKGEFGPYFQMQRTKIYDEYVQKLLDEGKAYKCFCSTEELAAKREQAQKEHKAPKYDNKCRNLSTEQIKNFENQGIKPVIRFKNDGIGETIFKDIIKGEIRFDNSLLDDFVIVKSSGVPVYNFAVVIDDALMEISHVVRGDDHISNTPRQIMLYKAFGFKIPKFAHIPMILGSDGSRLSKRHGATSVLAYREMGFLPDALVNYLALLGWSTQDSQQIFSHEELVQKFDLYKCSSSAAIFDDKKLLWLNGEYIRAKSLDEFTEIAISWLEDAKLVSKNLTDVDKENLKKIIALEQEKVKYLTDIPGLFDFMLKDEIEYNSEDVEKVLIKNKEISNKILKEMLENIRNLEVFTAEKLEELFRSYAEKNSIKTGQIFHPVRVATSGRTKGPSLFHYLEVLGKEKVVKRLENTLKIYY